MAPSVTITFSGNTPITISGVTASSGAPPAVLQYKNYVYAVYATSNPDAASLWQLAYNGSSWQGNQGVGFTSGGGPSSLCAPALAELKGTMYLAWVDQSSTSDGTGSILIASASASAVATSPIPSTGWQLLPSTYVSGMNSPEAGTQGLAMVTYPYNDVSSLWVFYNNNGGDLCVAIAQPSSTGVNWVYANRMNQWTTSMSPKLTGCPTAAVLDYVNATGDVISAPYVVFIGSSGSYLSYVYLNPNTNQWEGNEHISVDKGNPLDLKAGSTPNLLPLPQVGSSPGLGMLFYQGNLGTSIDASVFENGTWYGNVSIDFISGYVGSQINPTTNIGLGSALYNLNTIVMVYPSASSSGNKYLWAAYAKVTAS